ncbi:MAG: serine/threonine-protein phosphatase [Burkholderiaceae bacterium]|nr:serine/threonine-protein phosphatase [Burkholderiaceae bacterium]MCP5287863.1 serine/threonine-protein phosphatase [Burkholderiaceae bacterium]HMQ71080.1 protein phosphatase 2C domain-containing protein [Rubrivivax sp.]
MSEVRIAACSEPGARSHNEDDLRHGHAAAGHYAVLADGAGGHKRGAEAARRSVLRIESELRDHAPPFEPESLTRIVRRAHAELQRGQAALPPEARMHCTVVVLWVDPAAGHALWTHVGDSRLYRVRHGRTDIVTADDSVVHRMLQAGLITPEQSRHHPQKNQLLAALGIDGEVDPHTVARPVEVLEGDAFLLCTDGWWDGFDAAAIAASLSSALTPQAWLQDMQAQIVRNARPRQDNYSAIAVWVGDPAEVACPDDEDTIPRARPASP